MAGRLLLDENLSPRLARDLAASFPGSAHVRDVALKGQSDHQIWTFAADNGFTILTKDDDFRGLSLLRGAPPKVIWLVVGNTSTAEIRRILLAQITAIEAFISAPTTALLTLRKS
jgi:predicted nuclease of predicted toxin-antitoxin system